MWLATNTACLGDAADRGLELRSHQTLTHHSPHTSCHKSLICPRPGWVNNPLQHRWFLCSGESWEALKLGSSSSQAWAEYMKCGMVLSGHVLLLLHPLFVHQTTIRPILGTDSWQRRGWCFRGQLIFADICPRALPSALSLFGGLRVWIISTATVDRPVVGHLWKPW